VVQLSLAVVDPQMNSDALSGLVLILRSQAPTVALLGVVLSLPPKFGPFVVVVMTGWVSSHYTPLLLCLQQLSADSLLKDGRFRKNDDDSNNVEKSLLPRFVTVSLLLRSLQYLISSFLGAELILFVDFFPILSYLSCDIIATTH